MPVQIPEGNPLADHPRYNMIRKLNQGAFGFVVLAEDTEVKEKVAIKFIPRGSAVTKNVKREVLNHKHLSHHHVIQFKGIFLTRAHLAIVMEYAPGGDLMDYIRKQRGIAEDLARWFFQQLIIGLDYIHRMGIANRDIKLENTLLDDSTWPLIKICDFGYSKHELEDSAPHSLVGTRPYLAPEVVFRKTSKDTYDGKKADIWCCGVLLYVMMIGRYPFEKKGEDPRVNTDVIRERLRRLDYEIPSGIMSTQCEDLIRKILVLDPLTRLSIKEITEHPWFLKDLPDGALDMNEINEPAANLQSDDEIHALFEEATQLSD